MVVFVFGGGGREEEGVVVVVVRRRGWVEAADYVGSHGFQAEAAGVVGGDIVFCPFFSWRVVRVVDAVCTCADRC